VSAAWAYGSLPALFFDDDCPLCTRSAWFIGRRDRRRTLRLVALASDEGRAVVNAHPALASVDSLIWLDRDASGDGLRALTHSAAVLAVWRYLGGGWSVLAALGSLVPRPLRDGLYRIVARHRPSRGPVDLH
jgi:predicted DCC family thiol-disulfide oxidoreductase YuxK